MFANPVGGGNLLGGIPMTFGTLEHHNKTRRATHYTLIGLINRRKHVTSRAPEWPIKYTDLRYMGAILKLYTTHIPVFTSQKSAVEVGDLSQAPML